MFGQSSEQIWITTKQPGRERQHRARLPSRKLRREACDFEVPAMFAKADLFFNYLWRRHHVQTWINIAIYAFVTSHVGECFNQKSITDDHFPPWPVSFSVFVPWRTNVSLSLCFRVVISWCIGASLCLLTANSHLGEYPRIFFHCFEIFVLDRAIATPSK